MKTSHPENRDPGIDLKIGPGYRDYENGRDFPSRELLMFVLIDRCTDCSVKCQFSCIF
jgi:hypothetical protein